MAEPPLDRLLERDRELTVLSEAVRTVELGGGAMVLVAGPAGIGKTRLLEACATMAAGAGATTLRARGSELERGFAWGVVRQLLDPILDRMPEKARDDLLAGPGAPARALFATDADVVLGPLAEHAPVLAHALLSVFRRLAARHGGLAVVVDDLQWADEPSVGLLGQLSEQAGEAAVLVVLAARSEEGAQRSRALGRLMSNPAGQRIDPAPLSAAGTAVLLAGAGPAPSAELVDACLQSTGGNPFLVGQLAAALTEETFGAASVAEVRALVPEGVLDTVLSRLGRLPEQAQSFARALSILGDRSDPPTLAALAGIPADAVPPASGALVGAGICDPRGLAFAHPLIGTAVAASIGTFTRARMHRRAAGLLLDDGASWERVAAHLLQSRPDGDEAVVDGLRAAARQAMDRGDGNGAVMLLERALLEPPARAARADVTIDLAFAEAAAGRPGATARAQTALALVDEPHRRAQVLRLLGELLFFSGDAGAAAHAADIALEALEPGTLRDALLAEYLMALTFRPTPGAPPDPRMLALLERSLAGELPEDPALLVQVTNLMAIGGAPPEVIGPMARRVLAGASDGGPPFGLAMDLLAAASIDIDDLDLATAAVERGLDSARRAGSMIRLGTASYWDAQIKLQRGALDAAIAATGPALEAAAAGWTSSLAWTLAVLSRARLEQGDRDAAEAALTRMTELEPEAWEHVPLAEARGRIALRDNDPATALELFLDMGRRLGDWQMTAPVMFPWRSLAAVALGRLHRRAEALELAEAELDGTRAIGSPRQLGVSLRTVGALRGDLAGLELLEEAAELHRASPSGLERIQTFIDLGAALRRHGRTASSGQILADALALAREAGAVTYAAQAREQLELTGSRDPDAELTRAEALVAGLAAGGEANRAVADRLGMSVRTVEWHLGNVYRKLGVDRSGLADALADLGAPGALVDGDPRGGA